MCVRQAAKPKAVGLDAVPTTASSTPTFSIPTRCMVALDGVLSALTQTLFDHRSLQLQLFSCGLCSAIERQG